MSPSVVSLGMSFTNSLGGYLENPDAASLVVRAASGPRLADIVRRLDPGWVTRGGMIRPDFAGRLLILALSLAEHDPVNVSKEAAYTTFSKACQVARLPDSSRANLVKIFDDFEPVAHFWAATIIAPPLWEATGDGGAELAEFLGFAERLRSMSEQVRLDKGRLLDPQKTWKVPDRFVPPPWNIPLPTPAMLAESMKGWKRDFAKSV